MAGCRGGTGAGRLGRLPVNLIIVRVEYIHIFGLARDDVSGSGAITPLAPSAIARHDRETGSEPSPRSYVWARSLLHGKLGRRLESSARRGW